MAVVFFWPTRPPFLDSSPTSPVCNSLFSTSSLDQPSTAGGSRPISAGAGVRFLQSAVCPLSPGPNRFVELNFSVHDGAFMFGGDKRSDFGPLDSHQIQTLDRSRNGLWKEITLSTIKVLKAFPCI
jgi:hypothetical protein